MLDMWALAPCRRSGEDMNVLNVLRFSKGLIALLHCLYFWVWGASQQMVSLAADIDALLTGKIQGGLDHAEEVNEQSYLTVVILSTCFFPLEVRIRNHFFLDT